MKRIYLIDCPGVVAPNASDSEEDLLLRGVVRVENVENPAQYIDAVLKRTKLKHIERTYDIRGYQNSTEFLEALARKAGRLLKGGEADVDGVAKMVLNDFMRGKVGHSAVLAAHTRVVLTLSQIPWFTPPPLKEGTEERGIEGREGRLGEMGKKRKREDEGSTVSNTNELNEEKFEEFEDEADEEPEGDNDDNDDDNVESEEDDERDSAGEEEEDDDDDSTTEFEADIALSREEG